MTTRRSFLGRSFLALGVSALLTLSGGTTAKEPVRAESTHYLDTSTFDLARVLAPPPADDSPATRAELDEMLRIQGSRSEEQVARAKADAEVSVFRFADVVGSDRFTAANLPLTIALFKKISDDELWAASAAKNAFGRPRPFLLEPKLQPLLARTSSTSYPSGHSMWGYAVGLVLADMLPEKRAQIMVRAREYATNRVVVGMHYPSDIESGIQSGVALVAAFFSSSKFRADQAAATKELRSVMGLAPLNR
jgi:acid phosphatase (class A)